METDKNVEVEENENVPKDELRVFLIDLLTDLECLKGLIYNGSDVAAHRNTQKVMDKIKAKIREGIKEK